MLPTSSLRTIYCVVLSWFMLGCCQYQLTVTAQQIQPVTNLIATWDDGQVVLSWTAAQGATSYQITSLPAMAPIFETTTSKTITGLTNNVRYQFNVVAISVAGSSAPVSIAVTPRASVRYTGPTNGRWDVATNWSPQRIPTSDDVVLLSTNAVLLSQQTTQVYGIRSTSTSNTGQLGCGGSGFQLRASFVRDTNLIANTNQFSCVMVVDADLDNTNVDSSGSVTIHSSWALSAPNLVVDRTLRLLGGPVRPQFTSPIKGQGVISIEGSVVGDFNSAFSFMGNVTSTTATSGVSLGGSGRLANVAILQGGSLVVQGASDVSVGEIRLGTPGTSGTAGAIEVHPSSKLAVDNFVCFSNSRVKVYDNSRFQASQSLNQTQAGGFSVANACRFEGTSTSALVHFGTTTDAPIPNGESDRGVFARPGTWSFSGTGSLVIQPRFVVTSSTDLITASPTWKTTLPATSTIQVGLVDAPEDDPTSRLPIATGQLRLLGTGPVEFSGTTWVLDGSLITFGSPMTSLQPSFKLGLDRNATLAVGTPQSTTTTVTLGGTIRLSNQALAPETSILPFENRFGIHARLSVCSTCTLQIPETLSLEPVARFPVVSLLGNAIVRDNLGLDVALLILNDGSAQNAAPQWRIQQAQAHNPFIGYVALYCQSPSAAIWLDDPMGTVYIDTYQEVSRFDTSHMFNFGASSTTSTFILRESIARWSRDENDFGMLGTGGKLAVAEGSTFRLNRATIPRGWTFDVPPDAKLMFTPGTMDTSYIFGEGTFSLRSKQTEIAKTVQLRCSQFDMPEDAVIYLTTPTSVFEFEGGWSASLLTFHGSVVGEGVLRVKERRVRWSGQHTSVLPSAQVEVTHERGSIIIDRTAADGPIVFPAVAPAFGTMAFSKSVIVELLDKLTSMSNLVVMSGTALTVKNINRATAQYTSFSFEDWVAPQYNSQNRAAAQQVQLTVDTLNEKISINSCSATNVVRMRVVSSDLITLRSCGVSSTPTGGVLEFMDGTEVTGGKMTPSSGWAIRVARDAQVYIPSDFTIEYDYGVGRFELLGKLSIAAGKTFALRAATYDLAETGEIELIGDAKLQINGPPEQGPIPLIFNNKFSFQAPLESKIVIRDRYSVQLRSTVYASDDPNDPDSIPYLELDRPTLEVVAPVKIKHFVCTQNTVVTLSTPNSQLYILDQLSGGTTRTVTVRGPETLPSEPGPSSVLPSLIFARAASVAISQVIVERFAALMYAANSRIQWQAQRLTIRQPATLNVMKGATVMVTASPSSEITGNGAVNVYGALELTTQLDITSTGPVVFAPVTSVDTSSHLMVQDDDSMLPHVVFTRPTSMLRILGTPTTMPVEFNAKISQIDRNPTIPATLPTDTANLIVRRPITFNPMIDWAQPLYSAYFDAGTGAASSIRIMGRGRVNLLRITAAVFENSANPDGNLNLGVSEIPAEFYADVYQGPSTLSISGTDTVVGFGAFAGAPGTITFNGVVADSTTNRSAAVRLYRPADPLPMATTTPSTDMMRLHPAEVNLRFTGRGRAIVLGDTQQPTISRAATLSLDENWSLVIPQTRTVIVQSQPNSGVDATWTWSGAGQVVVAGTLDIVARVTAGVRTLFEATSSLIVRPSRDLVLSRSDIGSHQILGYLQLEGKIHSQGREVVIGDELRVSGGGFIECTRNGVSVNVFANDLSRTFYDVCVDQPVTGCNYDPNDIEVVVGRQLSITPVGCITRTPLQFDISPDVPNPLTFNRATGLISGRIAALMPKTDYVIVPHNDRGAGEPFTLSLEFSAYACPAGSYCPSSEVQRICPIGKYCPRNSITYLDCSEGSYCPEGSASNSPCPAGNFCPNPTEKKPCLNSEYCPAGSIAAQLCAPRHYCPTPKEQISCLPGQFCPAGTFDPQPCPPGRFCPTADTQEDCPAQNFCRGGVTRPSPCQPGSYCPAQTTSEGDCPAGFFCETTDTIELCPLGRFCPPRTRTPQFCSSGSHCPAGRGEDTPCPAGSFCRTPTEIQTCPEGHFCPERSVEPRPCEVRPGGYCPEGTPDDNGCPAGFRCPTMTSREPCEDGQHCPVGTFTPQPCQPGAVCTSPATSEPCPEGYYCPRGTSRPFECRTGHECPTGSAINRPCQVGRYADIATMPVCAECGLGKFSRTEGAPTCSSCPPGSYQEHLGQSTCVSCGEGYATKGGGHTTPSACYKVEVAFIETALGQFVISMTSIAGTLLLNVLLILLAQYRNNKIWERNPWYAVHNIVRKELKLAVPNVSVAGDASVRFLEAINVILEKLMDTDNLPKEPKEVLAAVADKDASLIPAASAAASAYSRLQGQNENQKKHATDVKLVYDIATHRALLMSKLQVELYAKAIVGAFRDLIVYERPAPWCWILPGPAARYSVKERPLRLSPAYLVEQFNIPNFIFLYINYDFDPVVTDQYSSLIIEKALQNYHQLKANEYARNPYGGVQVQYAPLSQPVTHSTPSWQPTPTWQTGYVAPVLVNPDSTTMASTRNEAKQNAPVEYAMHEIQPQRSVLPASSTNNQYQPPTASKPAPPPPPPPPGNRPRL